MPALVIRYHVCSDWRGMALCISGHERAVQKDHWAVHERPVVGGAGSNSTKAGRGEGKAIGGSDPSFGPRKTICELWISGASQAIQDNAEHEQKRQLLR